MSTLSNFREKYGPWALVTGASSGIGFEFAKQIAAKKLNIILVARREDKLQSVAKDVHDQHGADVKVVVADLTADEGIEAVKRATGDIEIGLLVNNAGREDSGHFLSTPLETALNTLDLNARAPLKLTHHFAQKMADRKRGGIIFMSSIVSFQGVPFIANYAATKAYDLIFAESLAAELKQHNIDVIAAAPGFTETGLSPDFEFTGLPIKPIPPALVASLAIKGLGKKRLTVPGAVNKFLYISGKYLLPRSINTLSFGMVFRAVLRKKLGNI
ncbi:MAG: SDR family NAD(P)-dependent oxidoreductase [Gammaproteobacteria bacterium]